MFKFSLQTALDVRKRQEKIRMKELAEKIARQQEILNEIDQIRQDTKSAGEDLNQNKQKKYTSIDQMKFMAQFKDRMKMKLGQCYGRLEVAKKEVAEKQKLLIDASRARKTLEILREKEYKKLMAKIARQDRIIMDEIAGNLYVRNKSTI